MAAFRESYGKLFELRSLASDIPIIALTATATHLTRDTIVNILHMEHFVEINESPNKTNLRYVVHCMDKKAEHEEYFVWLADTLRKERQNSVRTILYCQTIKQCSIIYATISGLLGKDNMTSDGSPLVELLHSCSPQANKNFILESFQQGHGAVRLLIATIAFGMGVDCKGVKRIIHYGPSKNLESYVQETGRAGRDGGESVAFLLYHGVLLNHVHSDIKSFIKTKECRRATLMKHFDADAVYIDVPHMCCDICAKSCDCGQVDCSNYCKYPSTLLNQNVNEGTSQQRSVSADRKKLVENALNEYHKELVLKLLNTTAKGEVKTLTNLHFMLGFSEHQISQVLENVASIFTLSDIYKSVEVWDERHAQKILSVISSVFEDESCDKNWNGTHFDSNYEFDDEFMDEWDEILQDNELFDMIVENISLSQFDASISLLAATLDNSTESLDDEMPSDILEVIERV